MNDSRTLDSLAPGESGVVAAIEAPPELSFRLMHMGIWPGETVTLKHRTPLGGPLELDVMGYRLAMRREDARAVRLR